MQDQITPEDKKNQEKKDKLSGIHNYAKYSGLAFQMIAIILITVWAGTKLDKLLLLETPVFTIVLSLLGVAAAIYTAIKDFIR